MGEAIQNKMIAASSLCSCVAAIKYKLIQHKPYGPVRCV